METAIKYKKQGDGRDSWEISEYEGEELVNRYMVYEDPNIKPIPKVDVIGLLKSMSEEELNQLREILK